MFNVVRHPKKCDACFMIEAVEAVVSSQSGLTNPLETSLVQAMIKISVNTDISVIGFYGNIGNIGKYRWKFLQKYRFD